MSAIRKIIHKFFLLQMFVMIMLCYFFDGESKLYAAEDALHDINPLSQITTAQWQLLRNSVAPINTLSDYDSLIDKASLHNLVLIGDSTHGTHEFYQQRIELSKRLIKEKNFKLIALEGDWPNVYALNQYIQSTTPLSAQHLLNAFNPHAAWLWNNWEMFYFLQWLKNHNDNLPEGEQKVSLLGIDIYSFDRSMKQVVDYLDVFSHDAAQQAYQRYQCFQYANFDLHRYGQMVKDNPLMSCENSVSEQFKDFSECRIPCPEELSAIDRNTYFYTMQNARVVKNTEKSLRLYYVNQDSSAMWNERDRHMLETIKALMEHLHQPKTIVWAHSSHLGDARATEMSNHEQINLGQLLRQYYNHQVFSIGMLSYQGQVVAADEWDDAPYIKTLLPAHPQSNEALFHQLGIEHFVLDLNRSVELRQLLEKFRLQRHVGVVYRQDDELNAHYTHTILTQQFDAIIYLDRTTAVQQLKRH